MRRTLRGIGAATLVALCVWALLPAKAFVAMDQNQNYDFTSNGTETAWVLVYDYDADDMDWRGPWAGPTTFSVSFSRSLQTWYGLYTYSSTTGAYHRAYYLYYTQSL